MLIIILRVIFLLIYAERGQPIPVNKALKNLGTNISIVTALAYFS